MGITFSSSATEEGHFLKCSSCGTQNPLSVNTCKGCSGEDLDYEKVSLNGGPVSVDMANGNAFLVMKTLNIPPEPCGSISGPSLQGLVVYANALDETALLAFERYDSLERGNSGATIYTSGYSAETLLKRIRQISVLAQHALRNEGSLDFG